MSAPDVRDGPRGLPALGDERLAALVRAGDEAAFETLHRRHRAALLAFCRHLLHSREDAEDVAQQTFLRAHRALVGAAPPPRCLRSWLYAIARNRCLTLLAGRTAFVVPLSDDGWGADRVAEDVEHRASLRELVVDLLVLPADQRAALVLSELGDLSHAEIGLVLGCPASKVKALIFQGRSTLIAERDARETPCAEVLAHLATAHGGALRRGPLRRHLRECETCRRAKPPVVRKSPTPVAPGGSPSPTSQPSL
jgi:RNA polymerase sigma factor (sigma-70 family)